MRISELTPVRPFFILFFFTVLFSCTNNQSQQYLQIRTPDSTGNLIIKNETGSELSLFYEDGLIKIIPMNAHSFLVNIKDLNNGGTLEIMRDGKLYRSWEIKQSEISLEDDKITWIISNEIMLRGATISFSYPVSLSSDKQPTLSVDVYVNNKQGIKLLSFDPGMKDNKKIGIESGIYEFYYRYWNAGTHDNKNPEEIGWNKTSMLLFEEGQHYNIVIPVFNESNSELEKK